MCWCVHVRLAYTGNPVELSFWLARNLPWPEHTRQQLLEEPSGGGAAVQPTNMVTCQPGLPVGSPPPAGCQAPGQV